MESTQPTVADEWMEKLGVWFTPIPETGCWIWMRGTTGAGYGAIYLGGRDHLAHRVAYELLRGPIPPGMTIDHLCRVRSCVNPDHLEVVTVGENVLRGISISARNAQRTHCINGHEFTPENTYHPPLRPTRRHCRMCNAARQRARKA